MAFLKSMPIPTFFSKPLKIRIYELKICKLQQFQYLAMIFNDDLFVSAATAKACFMVHLVCLFIKTYLLTLLQDNCFDLVRCAFLHKLSICVRNITAFCQHLLRPIFRIGQYRYIGKTQISADYISQANISVYLHLRHMWPLLCQLPFRQKD